MIWVLVVIVVLLALAGLFLIGFNRLRRENIAVDEALADVDVQLSRRADLIPNLVSTVKGYAEHERGVFEEVTNARAGVQQATDGGNVAERSAAAARLDQAILNVLAVAEAYPDLKASTSFLDLQRQLAETETLVASSRQRYNDDVARLNTSVGTIPWMLFTGPAGVSEREFYQAPEGAATPPTVSF